MKKTINVTINGRIYEEDVEPRLLLSHFLREKLGFLVPHTAFPIIFKSNFASLRRGESTKVRFILQHRHAFSLERRNVRCRLPRLTQRASRCPRDAWNIWQASHPQAVKS